MRNPNQEQRARNRSFRNGLPAAYQSVTLGASPERWRQEPVTTANASDNAKTHYAIAYESFDIQAAARSFVGDFKTGINVCAECCDRWAADPDRIALHWEDASGSRLDMTFAQLRDASGRFANLLTAQGIVAGDCVSVMLPRVPELLIAALGIWRAGAVYQPMFTAFGSKAIEHRLAASRAKLVVTDSANRGKFDDIEDVPPIAVTNGRSRNEDIDLASDLSQYDTTYAPVECNGDDSFLLMSTSGTTGLPKGLSVPIRALISFRAYMTFAIDLRPDDVYWNMADPGWAYGLYYAVVGPLLLGNTTIFYDGTFAPDATYRVILDRGVTNLAAAPTAYRLLIAAGEGMAARVKGKLRAASSAGEPLNPEVIRWFRQHLDVSVADHYGQTEMGMCVNNHHGLDHEFRVGSTGFAMPGFRMVVLDEDDQELGPNAPGMLAVDVANSPTFWFTGYSREETPTIRGGYYRTGDTVELEPSGHISFVGRGDDVITSSGYRIGPFDVESALMEHPAVIEVAVIGKPDPERTEIVKAFIVLASGCEQSKALEEELRQHVRSRLSAHAYPREFAFVDNLPKTPSGKIQRFILRNAEKARGGDPD